WWRINYLRHEAGVAGRILTDLMERPRAVLVTILLGNTVVNVAASSISERWMERLIPEHGLWIAIVTMTFVLLVFGEITPKIFAIRNPERIALLAARPIRLFSKLIFPLQIVLEKLSNSVTCKYDLKKIRKGRIDFLTLVDESRRANILNESEYSVLTHILRMDSVVIQDVMVPRTDIIALPDTVSFNEAVKAMLTYDLRRIPLYSGNLDNIVGILYAKDLLGGWLNPVLRRPPGKLARNPFYVPRFISLKQLSHELSQHKCHLAIVLDEYGGTAGLVTHDDILRMIFAPGAREEVNANIVETLPDGGWVVEARITWDVLEKLLNVAPAKHPFRTLNGYLLDCFGRIPDPGEIIEVSLETANAEEIWRLEILTTEAIRIHTVRITRLTDSEIKSG
ncbi:hemolysin family protein, partial [bacterium]|nr:hemolysin family protein [bacterium]